MVHQSYRGVFYAEANLSSTFGRFVAADCTADRGPSCHCRAASCSPRPVLPSRTLVGSPRLAWRPLALLVTDGGPGGDLGGPPPGGSGFGKPSPPNVPIVLLLAAGIASYVPA